jgi:heme o synthase
LRGLPGWHCCSYDQPFMTARLRLAKLGLCLFIGSAVLFGAVLADPTITLRTFLVVGGVFFVAAGAASLNSLQELVLDGEMARTKDRPLPAGQLTAGQAGRQACVLLLGGFIVLLLDTTHCMPAAITALAVALYNGIYTPLKKVSVLAMVPGAICGALPAYIGWLAGGGKAVGFTAILLLALFILWQIPHFWLVLLTYPEDYVPGRLPNLLNQLRERSLKRLFIPWIGALAACMLMFAILPCAMADAARYAVVVNALCLPGFFFLWLRREKNSQYCVLFIALNCALLIHMSVLVVGRIAGA